MKERVWESSENNDLCFNLPPWWRYLVDFCLNTFVENTTLFRQQTCYSIPSNCFSTCLPPLVHMDAEKSWCIHELHMNMKIRGRKKHFLTDLTIKMQPAWHDFSAERCCNISESLLYDIRMCTHWFDLPKDMSFMKINGVSLNQNHGRTQSIEHQLILVAFSRGEINKCALFICVLPCGFLNTYTGTELDMNTLHAAFIRRAELQPKALTVPDYYKQFPVFNWFPLNLMIHIQINSSQRGILSGPVYVFQHRKFFNSREENTNLSGDKKYRNDSFHISHSFLQPHKRFFQLKSSLYLYVPFPFLCQSLFLSKYK